MSKYLIVVLVCLGLTLSGCDSGGGDGAPPDPCIGENIRSFTEDWSDVYYYALWKTAGHEYMWDLSLIYKIDLVWWGSAYHEDVVVFCHLILSPSLGEWHQRHLYADWVDAYNADVFLMARDSNGGEPIPVEGWINVCADVVTLHVEGHQVYYGFEAIWDHTQYNGH